MNHNQSLYHQLPATFFDHKLEQIPFCLCAQAIRQEINPWNGLDTSPMLLCIKNLSTLTLKFNVDTSINAST